MGQEITDPTMRVKVLGWIEGKLQMLDKLRKLVSAEPRKLPPPSPIRPGDLLGGYE
jgi:hypothetical protein